VNFIIPKKAAIYSRKHKPMTVLSKILMKRY